MLHSLIDLLGFRIVAGDPVGVLTDLLFDGPTSRIRYLRVESEDWLPGGDLLLAPEAVLGVDAEAQILRTNLGRDAVAGSPPVAEPGAPEPAEEETLHRHFRWTPYWTGVPEPRHAPCWGAAGEENRAATKDDEGATRAEDPSGGHRRPLRSAWSVVGFALANPDGEIGAIEDLILDLDRWMIRYLVVSTGVWLPGEQVLISPQWLSRIDWSKRTAAVDLPRARIEACPTYDRDTVLDRGVEEALHRAAGKPTRW